MTLCFAWLTRLVRLLCCGQLLRGLLLCGGLVAGGLPLQAQAVNSCQYPLAITTIYENSPSNKQIFQGRGVGRGLNTINFKYPMVADYVVFSGYFSITLWGCTGSNYKFESNLTDGTISNNPGLSLVAGQVSVDTTCEGNWAPIKGFTSVTFPTIYGGGSCTLTFPFTIKTNASVAPIMTTTLGTYTSSSPNSSNTLISSNGDDLFANFQLAFSPNSCVLTSTAPNVDLGLVQVSSASNPGSGGWTTFSLNFSNCGAPETAYTIQSTFSYTAYDASNPTLIANTGGTASKVGVEMALNDGVTTLASGTAYTLATTSSGVSSYSVPLKARIRAAAGQTPTAGSVKATATFTVAYP